MSLQSNAISPWLDTNLESALMYCFIKCPLKLFPLSAGWQVSILRGVWSCSQPVKPVLSRFPPLSRLLVLRYPRWMWCVTPGGWRCLMTRTNTWAPWLGRWWTWRAMIRSTCYLIPSILQWKHSRHGYVSFMHKLFKQWLYIFLWQRICSKMFVRLNLVCAMPDNDLAD